MNKTDRTVICKNCGETNLYVEITKRGTYYLTSVDPTIIRSNTGREIKRLRLAHVCPTQEQLQEQQRILGGFDRARDEALSLSLSCAQIESDYDALDETITAANIEQLRPERARLAKLLKQIKQRIYELENEYNNGSEFLSEVGAQ